MLSHMPEMCISIFSSDQILCLEAIFRILGSKFELQTLLTLVTEPEVQSNLLERLLCLFEFFLIKSPLQFNFIIFD